MVNSEHTIGELCHLTAVCRHDQSLALLAGHSVEQVEDLERWLKDFPAGSMLELDYSSVAELFSAVELTFDESVAQVRESLEALDDLDYEVAGERYAAVASRWAHAQALSYVN